MMRKKQSPREPEEGRPRVDEWCREEARVRRGYVPVVAGVGKESQRFMVSIQWLKHPRFAGLLEMAAQEFGYEQKGVLRIPCDAQHFADILQLITSSSSS